VSYIFMWILMLVLCVAVFALYHHFGEIYMNSQRGREDQGPHTGKQIKRIGASDLRGRSADLAQDKPALVVFLDVGCVLCADLRQGLSAFAEESKAIEVLAIVGGNRAEVVGFSASLSSNIRVIPDPRERLTKRYGVGALPFAVALDADGFVRGKGVVNDRASIEHVVTGAAQQVNVALREVG
jgi:hypothetical protein